MKRIFLVFLLLVAGLAIYGPLSSWLNKERFPKTSQTAKQIKVQQKVQGQTDFSSYQITEGKTALDLLKQTESPVTVGERENAFVVGINGIKAEEEKKEYWSLYVNEKVSQLGAGSYKLKSGDKVEWKIEKY